MWLYTSCKPHKNVKTAPPQIPLSPSLKGQSHELRMRDYLPLGVLTQQLAAITDMDSSESLNVKLGLY